MNAAPSGFSEEKAGRMSKRRFGVLLFGKGEKIPIMNVAAFKKGNMCIKRFLVLLVSWEVLELDWGIGIGLNCIHEKNCEL